MKLTTKVPALLTMALAGWLCGAEAQADPLHKVGDHSAYRHEDSGWLFPKQVGSFARSGAPYTIDGNSDVGARYEQSMSGPRTTAIVDVYAADSAAADANVESAKAGAARSAGASARLESEGTFRVSAHDGLRAVKVTYVSGPEAGAVTSLYFIQTDRWIVKVLASTQATGLDAAQRLDAFVNALPWDTLGSDPGPLH